MPKNEFPLQFSLFDDEKDVLAESNPFPSPRPDRFGQANVSYTNAREILTKASGFMESYDFTLNPYSGCSFGCTYCYAAFFARDAARTDSWGYWVAVKENAIDRLKKHKPGSLDGKRIYMSSVTDPYQPIEKELGLTRQLLELIANNHKVKLVVQTRSPTVVDDIPLYRSIESNGGRVQVNMTVTTDDEGVRKTFEPFCPSNSQRLRAIAEVFTSRIDACITLTPLLLVKDNQAFIDDLTSTGVSNFIVQPFHWKRGRFLAGTRDKAIELLSRSWNCSKSQVYYRYTEKYQMFVKQLKTELFKRGLPELGEGKDGFKPPF